VIAAFIAQRSVVGNFFSHDDFLYLYQLENEGFAAFVFEAQGGHFYLLRNVGFWLCRRLFDLNPAPYFWLALAAHLLNTGLLYFALLRSTRDRAIAFASALLWGTCLTHRGSIGWISAHGHVLAATAFLAALLMLPSSEGAATPARRFLSIAVVLFAGATCFGSGMAVALVFWAFAWLMLDGWPARRRALLWFGALAAILPPAYSAYLRTCSLVTDTCADPAPALSVEALGEIVRDNLSAWLRFAMHLARVGTTTLLTGEVGEAMELLRAAPDMLIVFTMTVALLAIGVGSARVRRHLTAWLLIALAGYGVVAVGRAALFSQWGMDFSMMARQQLRYQYLPQLGLVGAVAVATSSIVRLPVRMRHIVRAILVFWCVGIGVANASQGWVVPAAREFAPQIAADVERMHSMIRALPGHSVCLWNRPVPLGYLLEAHPETFPRLAALFVLTFPDNVVDGKRVYFVEPDPNVVALATQRRGTRIESLLVAPGHCPHG